MEHEDVIDMEIEVENAELNMEAYGIVEHVIGGVANAVLYVPQDLTEEQQQQARENIGITGDTAGPPGEPGKDGVSVTHEWDGTTLIVTSASGTSSADLKGDPGRNGQDGQDGQDGYTPVKNVDYFDGQDGAPGNGIKNAVLNADYTLTLTFDDGTSYTTPSIRGATGPAGAPGSDGDDGVGIASVTQTTTSSADGGSNVVTVTLTNGATSTFTVKNGSKGSDGATGKDGAPGQRGTGILRITTAPASYTTTTGGFTPTYRIALSTVLTQAKVNEVLVGDTLAYSYYHYPVGYVDASYVYCGTRVSMRGATGTGATITGATATVDDSTGTPAVTVTAGGSASERTFDFTFTGLKGRDGVNGQDGYTPQKGKDYWTPAEISAVKDEVNAHAESYIVDELAKRGQLKPEFANSIEDCTDEGKLYVLPDGYIYAYMQHEETTEGSTTPNFTNLLDSATINLNKRYNSSNVLKDANGYIAVEIRGVASGDVIRFKPASLAQGVSGGSQRFRLYNSAGTLLSNGDTATGDEYTLSVSGGIASMTVPSYGSAVSYARANLYVSSGTATETDLEELIVTANEEITYTTVPGGTTVTYEWKNTGHAFVPADYEDRIITLEGAVNNLEEDVEALKERPASSAISMMVYAPSPQLPADGSDTADFDAASINANEIYAYIDALAAQYPRYLTKETLGKDESGSYDWNRYTASRRAYDAWVKPTHPAMYAWISGSTVIYSVSVSPRVGDTMYTTAYIGTAYSTVTTVDTPNQTRTVNGLIFTRDKDKDIAPTLVYTQADYDSRRLGTYATWHNTVYNASRSTIGTISSISNGTLTDSNGNSYTRYPMGDRNSSFEKLPVLVIGANEHGGNISGDPTEPAIITARLIKDLCECRNADNPSLNILKSEYMIVFCPIINPWGYGKENGYVNSNGVNLDRNFDTPGWGNDTDTRHGAYGGSENETQYFMQTLVESGTKIALANHGLGSHLNDTTGEAVNAGMCAYMLGRNDSKYTSHLAAIAETMNVNYGLSMYDMGQAPGDSYGKTRSYMDHIGVEGGAVEMSAIDGYLLHGGERHTARVLEADYTLMLQFLSMLIDCQ